MKKFIMVIMLSMSMLFSAGAFAEASFSQIQTLIEKQEYRAAEKGLEEIIANHPKSAKAFYAMAQAQAGLGNLTKAQHALDKAMGINPALDFAPASSVENLKQAIHPQVAKIEVIEESHFWRNLLLIILFIGTLGIGYYFYSENEKNKQAKLKALEDARKAREKAELERIKTTENKAVVTKKVKAYSKPAKPTETMIAPGGGLANVKPVAAATVAPTPVQQPVVVNTTTNNSTNDMLMGAMLGHMVTNAMHNSNSSHKEVVREREVIREVPAKDSSWDDKPSEYTTRSSSWDDAPSSSSSRSSSWDSDSSSSRSSSWSSSSDSSSSSSWDSGSSDSGSSSSSWD